MQIYEDASRSTNNWNASVLGIPVVRSTRSGVTKRTNKTMERAVAAAMAGMMYREAEEEAARLRRENQERLDRVQRRRRRRLALIAHLSGSEQRPLQRYAQVNNTVPILATFFSGGDMTPAFRVSRVSIVRLTQMLPRGKPHGWSHELEVLVSIYCLACGASFRVTADIFSVPQTTVWRIIHNTVDDLMTIIHTVIHFPRQEEMEDVGAAFARLAGHQAFCRAAGAIDGCHIRVVPPAEPQKKSYYNRKLFPSIILQGICDAKGTFLDVYIGNPGSVHDALVLRRSPMYHNALYPPAGYFLLGDGGYPCLQRPVSVMTPYRQPVASQVEARYNTHHARGRNIIERTFGALKTRWRSIFLIALEIRPDFAPKVVAACCILHNICAAAGDIIEAEDGPAMEDGNGPDDAEDDQRDLAGRHMRARLAAQLSAPEERPACLSEHDYI